MTKGKATAAEIVAANFTKGSPEAQILNRLFSGGTIDSGSDHSAIRTLNKALPKFALALKQTFGIYD